MFGGDRMKILFTCGGTGGHIYPAIAMYHEFRSRIPDLEYLFVGSDYGLEREIMENEGIRMEFIPSRGIQRRLSIRNLQAVFCNLKAFFQARSMIKRFQPDLVISTGAYPTFHITWCAVRRHIPVFLIESNILPGLVTRLASGKARKVFVTSGRTLAYLRDPSRAEVTGTPSRMLPPEKTRERILQDLHFGDREKTVVVVGGSCGAEKINDSLLEILHGKEIPFQILWATGKKHFSYVRDHIGPVGIQSGSGTDAKEIVNVGTKEDACANTRADAGITAAAGCGKYCHIGTDGNTKAIQGKDGRVRIVDYIVNMNEIISVADLIVCRAGAMTIGEIKEFRVPAILIPFAQAAGNHQYFNALELEKAGCAVIRKEAELSGESLYDEICGLLSDQERLKRMRSGYDKISISNSNQKIFESIRKEMGPPAEAAERRSQC